MLFRNGQHRNTFILRLPKEVPWIDSHPFPSVQSYYPFLSLPFSSHHLVALPWRTFVSDECFGLVNMYQANTVTCRRGKILSTITYTINGTSYGDRSVGGIIKFSTLFRESRKHHCSFALGGRRFRCAYKQHGRWASNTGVSQAP